MDRLVTIILAGGASTRFGRPKQLADWGGMPLLEAVVRGARAWPADDMVVVLGSSAEDILDRVDLTGTTVVLNPEWEEGEASSLRVGLDVVSRDRSFGAAIVGAGDQPDIDPAVVDRLVAEYRQGGSRAVLPKYRYARGYPVVLGSELWEHFMGLEGDVGVLQHLQAHPEWVKEVWVDRLPVTDVDVPTDLPEPRFRP